MNKKKNIPSKSGISVFLPCRAGSKRIKNKNIKKIHNFKFGLFEIKISQLLKIKNIQKIYISTDDDKILDYCFRIRSSKILLDKRKAELCLDSTKLEDLISHASDLVQEDHILWTHVTSPFVNSNLYKNMISQYLSFKNNFDSLMSVNKIQKYLWHNNKIFNYKHNLIKWPSTQDLIPLYEITSGAFIASRKIYKTQKDRIGKNPYLFNLSDIESFDVDWPEDFNLLNQLNLFSK